MLRKVHINSANQDAPAEPSDLNCLIARRQLECKAGFPGIHPRTVLWSHSIWDVLELPNRSQLSREGILEGGIPQLPQWENLHGLEIPLRSGRGSHAQKPQPEPTSDPRRAFRCMRYWFRCAGGTCLALGLKPKSSLWSQTSVLTLLAQKTSRLAILDPQCSTLPDL